MNAKLITVITLIAIVSGGAVLGQDAPSLKSFRSFHNESPLMLNPALGYVSSVNSANRILEEVTAKGSNRTESDLNRLRLVYLGVLINEYSLSKLPDSEMGPTGSLPGIVAARNRWHNKAKPVSADVENLTLEEISTGLAPRVASVPSTMELRAISNETYGGPVSREDLKMTRERRKVILEAIENGEDPVEAVRQYREQTRQGVAQTPTPAAQGTVAAEPEPVSNIQVETDFMPPDKVLFVIRNTGNKPVEIVGPSESQALNRPQTYWIEAVDSTGTPIIASLPQSYGTRSLRLDAKSKAKLENKGFARAENAPIDPSDPSWRVARIQPGGSDRIVVRIRDWFPMLSPGATYDLSLKIRPSQGADEVESAKVKYTR